MNIRRLFTGLIGCLLVVVLLAGCAGDTSGPVSVLEPRPLQMLPPGGDLHVRAEMEMGYDVYGARVELWNVAANERHDWFVENPTSGPTFSLDETFELPDGLSPGWNYRLSVGALPAPREELVTAGLPTIGFSQRVLLLDRPTSEIVQPQSVLGARLPVVR